MKPARAKLIHRDLVQYGLLATDVLYRKMHTYDKEAKGVLSFLIDEIKKNQVCEAGGVPRVVNPAQLKALYVLMEKCDDRAIDCASKLAPYQTPKLESIEVKGKVDHRYVLRAPTPMKSVDQWMKHTGAERLKVENIMKEKAPESLPTPSLHDFTDDEDYNEPGMPN